MAFPVDRILETIYRRRATSCWMWVGHEPELIWEGKVRHLQVHPLSADDMDSAVKELLGAGEAQALDAAGHRVLDARYSSDDAGGMRMRVHASKEPEGYALSIYPLAFEDGPREGG